MRRPTNEELSSLMTLAHVIISKDSSEFTSDHALHILNYLAECEQSEKRATLEADTFLKAEHELSDAYLRIRTLLKDYGAFNTDFAPSHQAVWEQTEESLKKVLRGETKDS